jgi:hypothetical protein
VNNLDETLAIPNSEQELIKANFSDPPSNKKPCHRRGVMLVCFGGGEGIRT